VGIYQNLKSWVKNKNKVYLAFVMVFSFLFIISSLIVVNYLLTQEINHIKDINPVEYKSMAYSDVRTARKINLEKINEPKGLGYPWNKKGTILINTNGLLVNFEYVPDKPIMELSLDNNDDYKLIYFDGGDPIYGQMVKADFKQSGLSIYHIEIKPEFKDFDRLYVQPIGGDGMYSIGHIVFKDYKLSFNAMLIITYSILFLGIMIASIFLLVRVFGRYGVNIPQIPLNKGKLFLVIVSSVILLLFVFVILSNAWVAEDAYISFRTVDNFLNGYGLTWNIDERVQAYTHPMWMFVMTFANMFISSVYYASIVVSFLFCLIAIFRVVFAINSYYSKTDEKLVKLFLFILLLVGSKAFMDYTTSGLENPLSHLLLVLFYSPILFSDDKIKDYNGKRQFFLFFIASLAFFNRQDTVLLYIPVLVYILVMSIKQKCFWKTFGIALLGTLPATLWLAFSLFYYGFPFPNTAYAKLNTGVHFIPLVIQGFEYYGDCLIFDPVTLVFITVSLVFAFSSKERKLVLSAIGIILYLLYILKIGGDFMRGRFFALPFLLAVLIIIYRIGRVRQAFIIGLIITLISIIHPFSPIRTTDVFPYHLPYPYYDRIRPWGVADEKAYYFQGAGLLMLSKSYDLPSYRWRYEGEFNTREVMIKTNIGYYAYFSGPDCHFIDIFALAEPLLARLPIKDLERWRIGHFERKVPQGYYHTVKYGRNLIGNPYLKKYYDKLSLIIKGNLFDAERLKTIIKMNLGYYDSWIDQYVKEDYYK
jgi:arabinofuranosyltransferase